jgi:hypothetical protein
MDLCLILFHISLQQGAFMGSRFENKNEVDALVQRILSLLATSQPVSARPPLPALSFSSLLRPLSTLQPTGQAPPTQTAGSLPSTVPSAMRMLVGSVLAVGAAGVGVPTERGVAISTKKKEKKEEKRK